MIGSGPLRTVLGQLYRSIDAEVAETESDDARFECPSHCSECCAGNLFVVTGLEFAFLALHARQRLTEEERAAVLERAGEVLAACPAEETLRLERLGAGREERALPCPLLRDGRCLVYPARPVTCRLFGRSRFASGAWNGCRRIGDRFAAEGLREVPLPVVEDYSSYLGGLLLQSLGPDDLREAAILIGVSSLPDFIVRTEFRLESVAEACRALEE